MMSHLLLTEHVGLTNIVHDSRIVPELLQDSLTAERLFVSLLQLWNGPEREQCVAHLQQTAQVLGGQGAMKRLAGLVLEEMTVDSHL